MAGTIHAGITKYLEQARPAIEAALAQGLIKEGELNDAIRPNLRVLLRLGLLDPTTPYDGIQGTIAPWLSDEHRGLARRAAQESIVLLKNKGLLPLKKGAKIALIGSKATDVLQDWYGGVPPYKVSILDALKARGVGVTYAADDHDGAATRAAKAAGVAIVCVGNDPISGSAKGWGKVDRPDERREAVDRKSIDLPDETLARRIHAANPRTVMVLLSSFPYAIDWSQANLPAIVQMAHSAQEQGNAMADVLFGDVDPAGRLPMTWPVSLAGTPPITGYNLLKGRTYLYDRRKPLFPFGYGLSYTRFRYGRLNVPKTLAFDGAADVTLEVTNAGSRAGDEVVQLYVRHLGSKVARPLKELKAFRRVTLAPGETKRVALRLEGPKLAYWNASLHGWRIEAERIGVEVGASSADVRLKGTVSVSEGKLPATSSLTAL